MEFWDKLCQYAKLFCILRMGGTGRMFGGTRQGIPKLIDSRDARFLGPIYDLEKH